MTNDLLRDVSLVEVALCAAVLSFTSRRMVARHYPALVGFVSILAIGHGIRTAILFFRKPLDLPISFSYQTLFFCGWATQMAELCLLVVIIYGLFSEAMRPFPGLKRIGKVVFKWVGMVSLLVAFALSVGPDLFSRNTTLLSVYAEVAPRFQQGINVLILCLLIFVCFSIRPLGLTFRSHIFGVVLGLGVFSTVQLVQAAWLSVSGGLNLYSDVYTFEALGGCVALIMWGVYFAAPEPKRRMILLPTTSPFFLWNRISEILGDAPGNVAIAGFTPDMLAPAEVEMLTLAISQEEASARERESALTAGTSSPFPAGLPMPSEQEFALYR